MKKIFSILSAALLLAGSFALTGCDEANEIANEILDNKGVWFKYEVKYGGDENDVNSGSSLLCYVLYSDSVYTNSNLSSEAYTNGTNGGTGTGLAAGLTLVVKNDSGSTVGKLANNTYAIHTFEKDKKVSESSTAQGDDLSGFSNFEVGSGLWNAFYIYNVKSKKLDRVTGIPPVVSKDMKNTFNPVQDFSWKKILAQLLVDGLLED